ncbi:Sulfotransferase 1C2 [Cladobotryum mycophilum]|uniref:Sulfotransferase 1C2 n=1 Tax=Cladobotryum mycophilum TaxID=491253 RepID=A0ABR0SWD4_9HYPO
MAQAACPSALQPEHIHRIHSLCRAFNLQSSDTNNRAKWGAPKPKAKPRPCPSTLTRYTPRAYGRSRKLETRASDVCFVSYPKSGTTWLSYIIVLITGNAGKSLQDSHYWVESNWTSESKVPLEETQGPRMLKSHMPYNMALGGDPAKNACKYIYIARNPKDVCSSYYHFESNKSWTGYYDGGWDHWLQMFVDGKAHRDDWFDHVLSWWEHRDAENILFLTYEYLKRDMAGQLRKVAQFLSATLDDAKFEEIEHKVSFSEMKKTDFSAPKSKEMGKFFRKGEIGSWKEYFTVAQNERFGQLYKAKMGSSGLTFTFE